MSNDLDAELFRIVSYLVACAACMPDFTLELASLMQLDAAERIIAMAQHSVAFGDDRFLSTIRGEMAVHKGDVMHDPAAFRNWISGLERRVVAEARRRTTASEQRNAGR
jgi:hypothetical protein